MKSFGVLMVVVLFCCCELSTIFAQSKQPTDQQAGDCSVNISGNGNTASLVCKGIDVTVAKQIREILDATRHNETKMKDVSQKLDQIISQMGVQPAVAIAPNGIANAAPNLGSQTVNNFEPPQRVLSDSQKAILVAALKQAGAFEVAIRHSDGNAESQTYADQLAAAIQDAGWTLRRPKFLIATHESYGVWVLIKSANDIPVGAIKLVDALTAAGIKVQGQPIEGLEPNTFDLVIGLNEVKSTP